ncbi:hypothetical protein Gotur_020267 [Gossypium turneri]
MKNSSSSLKQMRQQEK